MFSKLYPARRIVRWYFDVIVAAAVASFASPVFLFVFGSSLSPADIGLLSGVVLAGMFIPFAMIIAGTVWMWVRLTAIARRAREHRGLICRACLYPVSSVQNCCPECGLEQDMQETVALWQRFAQRRRRAPVDAPTGAGSSLGADSPWSD